jgi:hypothetical protein
LRILVAEPAYAMQRRHTLFKGGEPAIHATISGEVGAPRIVLGLGGHVDPSQADDNTQYE